MHLHAVVPGRQGSAAVVVLALAALAGCGSAELPELNATQSNELQIGDGTGNSSDCDQLLSNSSAPDFQEKAVSCATSLRFLNTMPWESDGQYLHRAVWADPYVRLFAVKAPENWTWNGEAFRHGRPVAVALADRSHGKLRNQSYNIFWIRRTGGPDARTGEVFVQRITPVGTNGFQSSQFEREGTVARLPHTGAVPNFVRWVRKGPELKKPGGQRLLWDGANIDGAWFRCGTGCCSGTVAE